MPVRIRSFDCKDSDSIQITAHCSTDMVSPTTHHSLYVFSVHLIKTQTTRSRQNKTNSGNSVILN